MPWFIFFLYSWILFLLFVDVSKLGKTIYGGFSAMLLGIITDWTGIHLGLYNFNDPLIKWKTAFILHVLGPQFTMGTIFFQFINTDLRWQAVNVAVFSLAYLTAELLILHTCCAGYLHWHWTGSLTVNLIVFSILSYLGQKIILPKKEL